MPISIAENRDCMIAMKKFPDKFWDLAICDPPYGIGENAYRHESRTKLAKTGNWGSFNKTWDTTCPDANYFNELFRISKNQIIWGANNMMHLIAKSTTCWIVWDKDNSGCFADCELAWASFETAVRKFKYRWNGMLQENMANKEERIHPTQKPIALYQWLLKNYAKPGDKILDTHLGSGSSRIAAYKMGFDFWGYELDAEYWQAQEKRFAEAIAEPLFDTLKTPEQSKLF